jgi:hypothetical protein
MKTESTIKGQVIIPKDSVPERLYFIMNGKVKLCFKRRQ